MRNLLVQNFVISFGGINLEESIKESLKEIKTIFLDGDKEKGKKSLKELRSKNEGILNRSNSVNSFLMSLSSQNGEESKFVLPFFKLLFDCLDLLIELKEDDNLKEVDKIIETFNSDNKVISNRREEVHFNQQRSRIIDLFKALMCDSPLNNTFKSFVDNLKEKLKEGSIEEKQ